MSTVKVAAIQMTSLLDYAHNLTVIERFVEQGKGEGVTHFFLPECFYSMSDGTKPTPHLVVEGNQHWNNIVELARRLKVFLLGGSVAYQASDKIMNRAINLSPQGQVLGLYDKMHLFSCELGSDSGPRKVINENVIYTAGHEPLIINAGDLKIGMGICFDLRFPEMWRQYAYKGANTMSISSAFTVPTGRAHWHTLVRARAIENQCFVIATGQWGRHNERIQTFGHSLIIDPWGEILADGTEGEKLVTAELNLGKIEQVRKSVKVF